jgi:peroxiredoxin
MLRPESDTLRAGDIAPDFTLSKADGTTVHLTDYLGKPLAIVFIRGTW